MKKFIFFFLLIGGLSLKCFSVREVEWFNTSKQVSKFSWRKVKYGSVNLGERYGYVGCHCLQFTKGNHDMPNVTGNTDVEIWIKPK